MSTKQTQRTQQTQQKPSQQLRQLANKIKAEIGDAGAMFRKSLEHARTAGQLLLQAQTECAQHGQDFSAFLRTCEVEQRTANNYMRIARDWSKIDKASKAHPHMTVRAALAVLKGKPRTTTRKPKPVTISRDRGLVLGALTKSNIVATPDQLVAVLADLGIVLTLAEAPSPPS